MTRARYPAHGLREGSQRAAYVRGRSTQPDVTLEGVTLGTETDKAILVTRKGEAPVWVPLSHIRKIERGQGEGKDTIVVTAWIAGKKGFT